VGGKNSREKEVVLEHYECAMCIPWKNWLHITQFHEADILTEAWNCKICSLGTQSVAGLVEEGIFQNLTKCGINEAKVKLEQVLNMISHFELLTT